MINQVISDIRITDINSTKSFSIACGLFTNHNNNTLKYTKDVKEFNVSGASILYASDTFTPQTYTFTANVNPDEMSEYKRLLRKFGNSLILEFTYNNTVYEVYGEYIEESATPLKPAHYKEKLSFKFKTQTDFLVKKYIDFDVSGSGGIVDGDALPAELPFVLGSSNINALTELIIPFSIGGDAPAFCKIIMFGYASGLSNPKYGINKLYKNTVKSYEASGLNLQENDRVVVNSIPINFGVLKNGFEDVSKLKIDYGHRTYVTLDPDEDSKIHFTDCLKGSITIYERYVLPR